MPTKRDLLDDPTSVLNRAADDEPLFILRSTDRSTIQSVQAWITNAIAMGVPETKIVGAQRIVIDIMRWQRANADKVSTPGVD